MLPCRVGLLALDPADDLASQGGNLSDSRPPGHSRTGKVGRPVLEAVIYRSPAAYSRGCKGQPCSRRLAKDLSIGFLVLSSRWSDQKWSSVKAFKRDKAKKDIRSWGNRWLAPKKKSTPCQRLTAQPQHCKTAWSRTPRGLVLWQGVYNTLKPSRAPCFKTFPKCKSRDSRSKALQGTMQGRRSQLQRLTNQNSETAKMAKRSPLKASNLATKNLASKPAGSSAVAAAECENFQV